MFCNSFCGKREDSFSWVEGGYICLHSSPDLHIIVDDEGVYHRCSPETIGVFTQELDREKQKIYEGDIIEFRAENGNDYFAVIKYGEYEQGSSGTTNVGFYAETLKPCLELFACAEITSDFRQQSVSQIACRCRVVAKSSEWEG